MKKSILTFAAAIAIFITACTQTSTTPTSAADSTATDTTAVVSDSVVVADTTADSTK